MRDAVLVQALSSDWIQKERHDTNMPVRWTSSLKFLPREVKRSRKREVGCFRKVVARSDGMLLLFAKHEGDQVIDNLGLPFLWSNDANRANT